MATSRAYLQRGTATSRMVEIRRKNYIVSIEATTVNYAYLGGACVGLVASLLPPAVVGAKVD